MKRSVIFRVLFLLSISGFSQHKFTSYSAHTSITTAIRINNEIIAGRTAFFEKQSQEKPLMFQHTKLKISGLNKVSNILSKYIETLQKEINTEQILYNMLAEDAYKKILFTSNNELSFKGRKLKLKIDDLYAFAVKINGHKLSQLDNFYKDYFKTDTIYYDFEENQLNYFEYHFTDRSNYGIMMALNCLLLEVKTFQLLYYGTVMSY
ncbi:hypothetical protein [Tenacibaculum finnmarkense]|uniref:hypothetical protein n=1 Tax=Tenacibaculum finnmarkense TaxID=2781243 RepID=UPI001E4DFC5D|nr:hypothetical protein [Tenacibaculum finnmarkense]MCD8411358.1 hypothetical protein [Tenacibaculum finnmarkense genomovar ulcerans]